MGVMAEMLEQYNTGEITMSVLRAEHEKQFNEMEAFGKEAQEKGWMALMDKVPGENSEQKVKSFSDMNDELARVERAIHAEDQAMAKQRSQRKALPAGVMEGLSKDAGAGRDFVGERAGQMETALVGLSAKMAQTEAFLKNFPDGRLPLMSGQPIKGELEFPMHMKDAIPTLKAFNISTPMPIDIVGRPYPMRVQPLDYFNIRTEPGSQIFYHQPVTPELPNPNSNPVVGRARVRMRGAPLHMSDVTWVQQRLTKPSLGSWMPVAYEDVADNASVAAVAAEQLMIDVRILMVQQLFNGNGGLLSTNYQWHGLLPQLTTTTVGDTQNSSAVPRPQGTAPNYINSDAIHPVQALVNVMVRLWERGMEPTSTAIFLSAADYLKVNYQQRLERYLQGDYKNYPMGDVHGVPLVLTDQLPANTILIGDTSQMNAEIVMGNDLQIGMSDDYRFANNQRAMRVVTYGNVALYRPLAFWNLTATNNLTVIRPGI